MIGASLAGLVAARVLRDSFDEVLIVERDQMPQGPEPRSGVPQSRHIHVLLVRGAQILEELFPGFRDELIAGGAPTVDWPSEILWLAPSGWVQRTGAPYELISASRDVLDWTVRMRVLGGDGVRLLDGSDVTGLLVAGRSSRVTGVSIRSRSDGTSTDLEADLVVDASGRNSHAPAWLMSLGYAQVQESVVNAFLGYSSRVYTPPAGFEADWKGIVLTSRPPDSKRAGVLFPLNGGLWHVTLVGTGHDYPPTDEPGFVEFARTLRSPVLHDALADAKPVDVDQWLSTDREPAPPLRADGVLPRRVRRARRRGVRLQSGLRTGNERRRPVGSRAPGVAAARRNVATFQKRLAGAVSTPWLLATSEDFRFPTTKGGRPGISMKLMHRYIDRVIAVGTVDDVVLDTFIGVVHLVQPPSALFRPSILARVLRGPRREALPTPPPAP